MSNEMELDIMDFLESGWTDEQIIGGLIRTYRIESSEARAALRDVLEMQRQADPPDAWNEEIEIALRNQYGNLTWQEMRQELDLPAF